MFFSALHRPTIYCTVTWNGDGYNCKLPSNWLTSTTHPTRTLQTIGTMYKDMFSKLLPIYCPYRRRNSIGLDSFFFKYFLYLTV